ncbi:MAG TPA: hypothetical protein PK443_01395 [bacterium]|nr:hypothetical protein [bacterium]
MRIFFFLFTLFLVTDLHSANSFLVAPTSAEIKLNRPNTISFVVTNNGDARIRVSVSPIFFPVGSKFMPPLKSMSKEDKNYDDISKNMVVSPKVISLSPGEQRTVRVSVRPPANLKDGEYRSHILFSMLDVASSVTSKKNGDGGLSMKLDFKSETAVVVYGSIGTGKFDLSTTCSAINKKTKVNIVNNGFWRFDGWLVINDDKDKRIVEEKVFMTRQTSKDVLLNWSPAETQKEIKISWIPLDEKQKKVTTVCKLR